jgi:hypothetical protein
MAGTLTITTLSDGTNSTSATNCIQGSAKAWVNFNGTTNPGTIRASYNVSSVTQVSADLYTVNFTNAMSDTNYVVSTSGSRSADGLGYPMIINMANTGSSNLPTTSSVSVTQRVYNNTSPGGILSNYIYVAIFR